MFCLAQKDVLMLYPGPRSATAHLLVRIASTRVLTYSTAHSVARAV